MDFLSNIADILTSFVYLLRFLLQLKKGEGKKNKWILYSEPLRPQWGFPGGALGKELACQCRRPKRLRFDPCIGKIPWRSIWQRTPAVLPGESQGQRGLMVYSP